MEFLSVDHIFACTLVASLGIGALFSSRLQAQRGERWMAVVVPPLMVICLFGLASHWVSGPVNSWNGARLAPLMGLKYGYPLYSTLDQGPILPTLYPPGAYLPYIPALLASTPTTAILIAVGLVMVYFFLPPSLILLGGDDQKPRSLALRLLAWCCFVGLALRNPCTNYQLSWIHADAPCLAALGIACIFLHRSSSEPDWKTLLGSAVFAVFAVWCKQTAVMALVALPLYVLLAWGWPSCVTYTILIGAAGVFISLPLFAWFGTDALLWNLFTIPGSHSLDPPGVKGLMVATSRIVGLVWLLGVLLSAIFIAQCWPRPGRPSSVRTWLAGNRWVLFVWLGLFLVPTGLLGIAKIGGDVNSLHSIYFWLCGLMSFAVQTAQWQPSTDRITTWIQRGALLMLLGLTARGGLRTIRYGLEFPDRFREISSNPQQMAYNFAKAHPHQAFFPWNPLSTLLAEGKMYHHGFSVTCWVYAHHSPTRERLKPDLPSDMRWIICQTHSHREDDLFQVFPEFSRRVELEGLSNEWSVYAK